MASGKITIGGASGYWGDAAYATEQLLNFNGLNFLSYDYLAEITMSLMARSRSKDPDAGFAPDFVSQAMAPNLVRIAENNVRVLSNAGGLSPAACGEAVRTEIDRLGLELKVAVVTGDDLLDRQNEFSNTTEMFDGSPFPENNIVSINAYLGAFAIAAALNAGADIVITGRCTDSALPLAACIHSFGWKANDLDALAAGSLAGHIIECGVQATGGNFTDWREAGDIADIGYPVAEISSDGSISIFKPENTSGLVSRATVGEQMLYEIGDPTAYQLPDVICDFSGVEILQLAENVVSLNGAKGRSPSGKMKVSATYLDGFRAGYIFGFNGRNASEKARAFAEAGLKRARQKLRAMNAPDYSDTLIEVEGGRPGESDYEEVSVKTAVRHMDAKAVGLFLKETMGTGLATPPGLNGFTGAGRPKPSPVIRLFSFLIDTSEVPVSVSVDETDIGYTPPVAEPATTAQSSQAIPQKPETKGEALMDIALEDLAWARSGDRYGSYATTFIFKPMARSANEPPRRSSPPRFTPAESTQS